MPELNEPVDCLEPERFELREPARYLFACDRREFLTFAGAGLLIGVFASFGEAQRGESNGALDARLHLGEDGSVTILTGKIEEGQGARTEIAMAAAEELRLPLERVRVQMADTGLTPNDGTTAGSGSTPRTIPQIRRAGAAARELLLKAASDQWKTDRASLVVKDGVVTSADGSRKLGYADIAKAPEFAAAYKNAVPSGVTLTAARDWRVLGTPQHRVNAHDIVTGAHRFPSDIVRPDMLYGSVLRAPSFGATLESVDLAEAKKTPGASAVRDGEFVGCTAPTRFAARRATAQLAASARWKSTGQPSSSRLFEHLKEHAAKQDRAQIRGSLDDGFKGARRRLEASYQVAYVQHAPMEPRAATAEWRDAKLTVWTGTSNPFSVQTALAQAFHIKPDQVRVIVPDFGGGFGGKHTGEAAVEAARLAREAGRPVNVQWTRAEEFMWAYSRPAALIEVQGGIDDQGRVVAWDFANYNSGASALESHYKVENVRTRYIPSESPLRQGSYRGLAATANNFARECFMDELAGASVLTDPLEFRLANLENPRIREVLVAAADRFGWRERRKQKRRPNTGIGLACGTEKNSVVAACVEIEVDPATGTPRLLEICEAFECGAVLNPANLRAQVEGAILMGLGAALREELHFENGRLLNGSFAKYRPTRFLDMPPKMEIVLVDKKDQDPVGAGETPIMVVAPAMANALFDATGQRVRTMPVRAPGRASS